MRPPKYTRKRAQRVAAQVAALRDLIADPVLPSALLASGKTVRLGALTLRGWWSSQSADPGEAVVGLGLDRLAEKAAPGEIADGLLLRVGTGWTTELLS